MLSRAEIYCLAVRVRSPPPRSSFPLFLQTSALQSGVPRARTNSNMRYKYPQHLISMLFESSSRPEVSLCSLGSSMFFPSNYRTKFDPLTGGQHLRWILAACSGHVYICQAVHLTAERKKNSAVSPPMWSEHYGSPFTPHNKKIMLW